MTGVYYSVIENVSDSCVYYCDIDVIRDYQLSDCHGPATGTAYRGHYKKSVNGKQN